jgi:hypothetical protein
VWARTNEAQASLARFKYHFELSTQQQYQLAVLFSEKRMYAEARKRFQWLAEANPRSAENQFKYPWHI